MASHLSTAEKDRRGRLGASLAVLALLAPAIASASSGNPGEDGARVLAFLAVLLASAKLGGAVAARAGQPAVLGELLAGVLLGNLGAFGIHALDGAASDPMIDFVAQLGVIVLLFEVGLESTVRQMLEVGASATLVAVVGVAAPFALGWGVGAWLLPGSSGYVHAFLGATLAATSVGITARVFQDLGVERSREARIVLGAAVLDDVLGLVVLAVVTGMIAAAGRGESFSSGEVLLTVAKAGAFLVAALTIGTRAAPRLFRLASLLHARGVLLAASLSFCFLLAWAAGAIGLAPIVGAFAAGLILEDVHYRDFTERGERTLEEQIHPLSTFLVPIFFMVMGLRTDLRALGEPGVFGLAIALTAAAFVGKQVCSLAVVERGIDRLTIGIGMIPRGEVGLIFASVGMGLRIEGKPVVDQATYSALVLMVIATTLAAPPALRWSLARHARREADPSLK